MDGYGKYMDVYVLIDGDKVIGVYKDRDRAELEASSKSSNLSMDYKIECKTLS